MDHTLKSQVLGQFDWFSADNKTMKEEMSDDYLCTSVSHFFFLVIMMWEKAIWYLWEVLSYVKMQMFSIHVS